MKLTLGPAMIAVVIWFALVMTFALASYFAMWLIGGQVRMGVVDWLLIMTLFFAVAGLPSLGQGLLRFFKGKRGDTESGGG